MERLSVQTAEILQVSGLTKTFGKRSIVRNVSFEVKAGQVVGLLGPNGAGKTTVFYMAVGLLFPDQGHVFLGGRDVTTLPLFARAKMGLAYLPQEHSLFSRLTVFDNIAMALEARGFNKIQTRDRVDELISQFGISHVAYSYAAALSGGERRRCEIARCLALDPKFVLLDEPFAGVDPIAVSEIKQYVQKLKDSGIGVLITDHNVRETLTSCDRGYLMREGKIFFSGSPEEIANNQEVRAFYLGQEFRLN